MQEREDTKYAYTSFSQQLMYNSFVLRLSVCVGVDTAKGREPQPKKAKTVTGLLFDPWARPHNSTHTHTHTHTHTLTLLNTHVRIYCEPSYFP